MTVKTFLERVVGYYGPYPAGQRQLVVEYLSAYSDRYRATLFDHLIRGYSSKWGKAPDVATFEELRVGVKEELRSVPPPWRPQVTDGSEKDYSEELARELTRIRKLWTEPAPVNIEERERKRKLLESQAAHLAEQEREEAAKEQPV
jgi:hypothetical protein